MGLKSEVISSVNKVEAVGRDFVKNYIALSIYDATGVSDNINAMPNAVTRNLARGFAFYLADEAEEDLMTGNSNLREMSVKVLVDDTIFDTMKSAVIEQISEPVSGLIGNSIPQGLDRERVITSVLWTSLNYAGAQMGLNHPLRKISQFIGWNDQ